MRLVPVFSVSGEGGIEDEDGLEDLDWEVEGDVELRLDWVERDARKAFSCIRPSDSDTGCFQQNIRTVFFAAASRSALIAFSSLTAADIAPRKY